MEFFLHPWYMVAGGALISSPILIHLINRMRFKRIRWAAMEFLLKSQKRNRRRLIIEQLILLFLRILLVLLAGFLVARFVQAGLTAGQGAVHVVIVDDTLSMSDRWMDKGQSITSFDQAKEEIKKVAKEASLANSAQQMKLLLLSDLETVRFDQRLNETSVEQLSEVLKEIEPTALHLSLLPGLEKARAIFNDSPQTQKILHLVSDFRDTDWVTGADAEKLAEETDKLTGDGINLSLLDCAHPFRGATRDVTLNHDNLAIIDFRAESRIVAEGLPVEFTVTIYNYGPSEKQTFLKVKKDGQEDFGASAPIEKLASFGRTEHKFTLIFDKKKAALPVNETDTREERQRKRRAEQEFVAISAEINAEETGVQRDNVRDLVLEVRKKVPTLVIDGNGPAGRQPGGDLFHLEEAFKAARSYEVDYRNLDELENIDLDLYPSVFLLNVASIRSEKALQNLQGYVKRGGNLAFFMGEKIQPSFYNDTLHKKYDGLFPVLIATRPTEPLTPEERDERKLKDPQAKLLFRDPKQPLVTELSKLGSVFRYLLIERYYPVQPRFQWEPEAQKQVVDLVSLPNRKSMDDYKQRAQELIARTIDRIKELSATEASWAKYQPVVENNYRRQVITALGTPYLFNLVRAFDNLLNDLGDEKDPQRPKMQMLWNHPGMASLKSQIESFRDTVLYGDPLVVAMKYGRGRVIACMTSAGTTSVANNGSLSRWNEWGGGNPASFTYPIFMMDLQRYLTSESEGLNRIVGDELNFKLEASRYAPKVRRTFQPQPEPGTKDARMQPISLGEQALPLTGDMLNLRVTDAKRPGVYTFAFFPTLEGAGEQPVESHVFAFNVDADAESDLRRAPRDRLERNRPYTDARTGKVALRSPGDSYDAFKNRLPDASESPWLYLLFLIVLIAEQALAVHLSFHLKSGEAPMPTAAGRMRTEPATAG